MRRKKKKLVVRNNKLFFKRKGRVRIVLLGCSFRNVLNWTKWHDWHNWHPWVRNLKDYIRAVKVSKVNYQRVDIKHNGKGKAKIRATRTFCRKMYALGVVVEVTIWGRGFQIKNWKKAVRLLGAEPNVILDALNEFQGKDWGQMYRALEKVNYIVNKGFIGGAGAWGRSKLGETIAKRFALKNRGQTQTRHMRYPPLKPWKKAIKADSKKKIVLCNELLIHDPDGIHGWMHSGAPWKEVESYVRGALKAEATGVNVLCGLLNHEYFTLMGRLCKEFN